MWKEIDLADALLLLSGDFKHPAVRNYAVDRIAAETEGDDDTLMLYLLQLETLVL